MRKTLTIIAAGLFTFTASCTYYTNSGNYSSKGAYVPITHPTPIVVQPAVRPIYVEPIRISVRSYSYRPMVLPPRCYDYIYID